MKFISTALMVAVLATLAYAQGSSANVSLSSQLVYPTGTCADVWADGDHVFIARRGQGFEIIDVSNPLNPVSVYSGRSDLFVQDLKVSGNLLFASNESGNGTSLVIFDITNLSAPVEIGSFGGLSMFSCNNLAVFGDYVYCCSLTANRVVVLDVSTPSSPVETMSIASQSPISLIHDVAVVNGKLYISWLSGGFEVHDLTTPGAPTLDFAHLVPTSLIHNAWPVGPDHIATTDEVSGGYVRLWDVSNTAAITQVSEWRANGIAVMHNLYVVGTYAFVTNYSEGLRILDLSDPANPEEAGFYDTFSGVNPFAFGAWGIHASEDQLYVADFNSGFYALDFTPVQGSLSAAQTTLNFGDTIQLTLAADSSNSLVDLPGLVDLSFTVPQIGLGPMSLLNVFGNMPPGANTGAIPFDIPLPPAPNLPTHIVDFTLTIADLTNGLVFDQQTVTITIN